MVKSAETIIECESLNKRFGHFTAERLNEPPEPSPGLSVAMPWVSIPQIIPRPEGAQEALEKSHT